MPSINDVEEQYKGERMKNNDTLDMDQRLSTDGCSNLYGVSTNVWSYLYIGDIDILLEEDVQVRVPLSKKDTIQQQKMNQAWLPSHHLNYQLKLIQ